MLIGSKRSSFVSFALYIMNNEQENNLNGFLLLTHIGTDPERADKFYNQLDSLINELKRRG